MTYVSKVFFLIILLFFLSLAQSAPAFAQFLPWDQIAPGCIEDVSGTQVPTLKCIPAVFQNIVTAALMFAGIVAVFFVAYAGIRYVTSRGDPKAVEGARNTLTWAIIGLIVIILSFVIINFIAFFTGASCINFFGFGNCA